MSGSLSFVIDDEEGLIRVAGRGMWTPEQAAIHFIELHRAILGLRAIRKPVLVLVDLREAAVQTAEVAEAVRDGTSRIYRDADHVAVVYASTLVILQIKRAARVPNLASFQDMDEAMTWLRARRGVVQGD